MLSKIRSFVLLVLCATALSVQAQDTGLRKLLERVDLSKVHIVSSDTVICDTIPDEEASNAKPADGTIDKGDGSDTHSGVIGMPSGYQYYRYTYPSVDAAGREVTLSGLMAFPYTASMGLDVTPRNVIVGCHVTVTSDDEVPYNYKSKGSLTSDVYMFMGHAMNHSYKDADNYECRNLVFMPDYQGYGLTKADSHPYLDQEITARQVVDGVIAGLAAYLSDTYTYRESLFATKTATRVLDDNWKMAAVGYSQGGAVAMAVQKFIEENGVADDLHFVGSVCGDGPYDPVATCKDYVDKDKVFMPVTLPLILKGMLDANPAMSPHSASDLMSAKFVATGILDWIAAKDKTTKDISKALLAQQGGNITYYKASTGEVLSGSDLSDAKSNGPDAGSVYCKASELLTGSAFNAMKNFDSTEKDFTNDHSANMDVFKALASNNVTRGWQPQKRLIILHSYGDEVVPYANCLSAYDAFKDNTNVLFYTYNNTSDPESMYHTKVGTSFFFNLAVGSNSTVSPESYAIRDLFGQSDSKNNDITQYHDYWTKGVIK